MLVYGECVRAKIECAGSEVVSEWDDIKYAWIDYNDRNSNEVMGNLRVYVTQINVHSFLKWPIDVSCCFYIWYAEARILCTSTSLTD